MKTLNNKPILTIAIPTYNRGNILSIALEKLLPQVKPYADLVEIVISNNASEDNTEIIISEAISNYPEINFIRFSQKENTGYFGNFRRCRELSNGKYFWLLSDNDHLIDGAFEIIIKALINNDSVGAVYLHSFSVENSDDTIRLINFENIKDKHKIYALMLISAVIVYNDKSNDSIIFKKFIDNDFLGFIFFLQGLKFSKNILIIEKKIFYQYPTKVTFNIFKSWIEDISQIINYAKEEKLCDESTINYIVNGFLERVVVHHIKTYLTYGNILGKKYGSKKELLERMDRFYLGFEFYDKNIRPIFYKKKIFLFCQSLLSRFTNKLRTIFRVQFK